MDGNGVLLSTVRTISWFCIPAIMYGIWFMFYVLWGNEKAVAKWTYHFPLRTLLLIPHLILLFPSIAWYCIVYDKITILTHEKDSWSIFKKLCKLSTFQMNASLPSFSCKGLLNHYFLRRRKQQLSNIIYNNLDTQWWIHQNWKIICVHAGH